MAAMASPRLALPCPRVGSGWPSSQWVKGERSEVSDNRLRAAAARAHTALPKRRIGIRAAHCSHRPGGRARARGPRVRGDPTPMLPTPPHRPHARETVPLTCPLSRCTAASHTQHQASTIPRPKTMMTTVELQYTKTADERRERMEEAFKIIMAIASATRRFVDNQPKSRGFADFCRDVLRYPDSDPNVTNVASNADEFSRTCIAAIGTAVRVPEGDSGDSGDGKRFLEAITTKVNLEKLKDLLHTHLKDVDTPTTAVDTAPLVTAILALLGPRPDVDTTDLDTTTEQGVNNLTAILRQAKESKDEEAVDTTPLVTAIRALDPDNNTTDLDTTTNQGVLNLTRIVRQAAANTRIMEAIGDDAVGTEEEDAGDASAAANSVAAGAETGLDDAMEEEELHSESQLQAEFHDAIAEAAVALSHEEDYSRQVGNKCIWNYQGTSNQTCVCNIGDGVAHDTLGAGKLLSVEGGNFTVDGIDKPKTAGHFRPDIITIDDGTYTWYYKGQWGSGWQTAGANTTVFHDFLGEGIIESIDPKSIDPESIDPETMTIKIKGRDFPVDHHAVHVRPAASFTVEVEHVPTNKYTAKDDPVYGPEVVAGIDIDSFTAHFNVKKAKGGHLRNHVRTRFTAQSTNKGADGIIISGPMYVVVVDVAPDNKVSIYKTVASEDDVKDFTTDILEYIKNGLSGDVMPVD